MADPSAVLSTHESSQEVQLSFMLLVPDSLPVLVAIARVGVVHGQIYDGNDLMTRRDEFQFFVCQEAPVFRGAWLVLLEFKLR
jgi:hypothetical protein